MKHVQFHEDIAPRYIIAVRDGFLIGCTGNFSNSGFLLSLWLDKYIEQGCTIYRTDTWFVVRYIGEKIPPEDLAKLELAVTAVLEGVNV